MKPQNRDLVIASVALTLVALSRVSITHIVAGNGSYFGLCNIIMPALALVGGITSSVLMTIFLAVKFSSGHLLVTKGLPTLVMMYSAQAHKSSNITLLLNIILPLCMAAAFVLHPVGGSAAVYTLFWLIPICCEIAQRMGIQSVFQRLLGATFLAHAVGSVIWLYVMPTTPATWINLLAVVPAERLVFASGATLVILFCAAIKALVVKNMVMVAQDNN